MSAAVILIKTPGPKGLVSRITTFVFEHGFNILDLARAVKAHLEHRVIVTGRRAIVFSSGA
jgi:formyltetrahydrofolate hydrolase